MLSLPLLWDGAAVMVPLSQESHSVVTHIVRASREKELQPSRVTTPQRQGHPGLVCGAGLAAGQGSTCMGPASWTAQDRAVLSSVPGLRTFENMKDSSSGVQTA